MSKVIEIIGCENKVTYAIVHVLLDDGTEAEVYVGGDVEVFLHRDKIKAFVKKKAS